MPRGHIGKPRHLQGPWAPKVSNRVQESAVIKPQEGPQEAFLRSDADIAILGGQAGGGKTWALLMDPLRGISDPHFRCVIFRRTYAQVRKEGGLWDTSYEIYQMLGAVPSVSTLSWRFPSGASISFAHMQHPQDRYAWDGAQITMIAFDQLESFEFEQFSYMFSRNRSNAKIRPYMRGTCNPNPDSFLRWFIGWWIDETTGFAIPERSGVLRWFLLRGQEPVFADTREELVKKYGEDSLPRSLTFIPASVEDNKILIERNPDYVASLESLTHVDKQRLRYGNWNIRETAGSFFKRDWFLPFVEHEPYCSQVVRYWDRAATPMKDGKPVPDASWTAGVKMGVTEQERWIVLDVVRFQGLPAEVERVIGVTAEADGHEVEQIIEQDPGQAGKSEAQYQARRLSGYNVSINLVRESKMNRAKPFSSQCGSNNVQLLRGQWNETYLRELENFDGSKGCTADQVDASSGAFHMLTAGGKVGVW
jgi:predicted phage terminase large subunit-like protein